MGQTALHFAVSNGYRDITEYLVGVGADYNLRNNVSNTHTLSPYIEYNGPCTTYVVLYHEGYYN